MSNSKKKKAKNPIFWSDSLDLNLIPFNILMTDYILEEMSLRIQSQIYESDFPCEHNGISFLPSEHCSKLPQVQVFAEFSLEKGFL